MNVSLTPELEKLVTQKVRTGMYQTASEVVREGLRLLRERDEHLELLRREVRLGSAAIERGEFDEYTAGTLRLLTADVNARGRKRLAAAKAKAGAR